MANDQNPLAQFGVVATPAPQPTDASNPLSGFGVPAQRTQTAVQPSTTDQPSKTADYLEGTVYPRVLQGVNDVAQPFVQMPKELLAPPSSPTEQLLHAVSPGGLPIYRLARNLVQAAERVKTAAAAEYPQAVSDYNRAIKQFKQHDLRNAIPSAVEAATEGAASLNPALTPATGPIRELAEGSRPGGNLAEPLTKDALTAGLMAAPELAEGDALATPTLAKMKINPFRQAANAVPKVDVPLVRSAVSGAKAINPAVTRIAGEAADAAATNVGVPAASRAGGIRTYLDEPIENVAARERATYDNLNKAATSDPTKPVDLKNLYDYREEIEDKLADPTNIASRDALNVELNRTNMQIGNAEATAQANGVSPATLKNAVADTRQRYALQEVKKKIFDNEGVVEGDIAHNAPESLDVKKAITEAQKLSKPTRYAPDEGGRLEQALGKDGAKKFLDNLYAAKKAGDRAVTYNRLAKWLAVSVGAAAVGAGVVEGVRAALPTGS